MNHDIANVQLVGVRGGDRIVVVAPRVHMTKPEALVHAAWLVALAEQTPGEFDEILAAVRST